MPQDLEKLRGEIEDYLRESGMTVFHGVNRMPDPFFQIAWDIDRHPDFHEFLDAARSAGIKLVVFSQHAFSLDQIDSALDQLEECDFTRDEKRQYESRIRQLQTYEGFTSSLELSFALDGRVYIFEQHTDWYEVFTDILGELDTALEEEEDVSEDGSLGGYFSNN